jgi:hypothetical protein
MYYHAIERKYKWRCFEQFVVDGLTRERGDEWDVEFPSTMTETMRPYKRLLAWRLRAAVLKHASKISPEDLNRFVTASELSEAEELSDKSSNLSDEQPKKRVKKVILKPKSSKKATRK